MTTRLVRTPSSPELFFKGRTGDPRLGEWARSVDTLELPTEKRTVFVLVGLADDTGVTLNRGRAGAKAGPDSIRKHFYKMVLPEHWSERALLLDLGNVIPSRDILESHRSARDIASAIASKGYLPLFLGGGHDFAAPCFLGFREGAQKKVSLLNVDPHLDVRELENDKPHSGTPFRQIIDSQVPGKVITQFGYRNCRNSQAHILFCKKTHMELLEFDSLRQSKQSIPESFLKALKKNQASSDWGGVTFDMDACSETEGVSAPPVVGFTAWEMIQMARIAGTQPSTYYFEIAEVAPNLETNERSSRIAAEMLYSYIEAKSAQKSQGNLKKRKNTKKK